MVVPSDFRSLIWRPLADYIVGSDRAHLKLPGWLRWLSQQLWKSDKTYPTPVASAQPLDTISELTDCCWDGSWRNTFNTRSLPISVHNRSTTTHSVITVTRYEGATFSKVPRILGKLLILGATDTQVAMSSRGYSTTVLTDLLILFSEVIGNCVVVVVIVVVR